MDQPRRHGCLSVWLVLIIFVNTLVGVFYLSAGALAEAADLPGWAFPVLGAAGFLNVLSAFAIWRWRRWGFWLFVSTSVTVLVVNLTLGVGPQAVLGLISALVLYAALQLGSPRGCDRLR